MRDWSYADPSKLQPKKKVLQIEMTAISLLLNVEHSTNVFVYMGLLICDSARGRPTGRLKSLAMPEIIIMSFQLTAVRNYHCSAGLTLLTLSCVVAFCLFVYTFVSLSG